MEINLEAHVIATYLFPDGTVEIDQYPLTSYEGNNDVTRFKIDKLFDRVWKRTVSTYTLVSQIYKFLNKYIGPLKCAQGVKRASSCHFT